MLLLAHKRAAASSKRKKRWSVALASGASLVVLVLFCVSRRPSLLFPPQKHSPVALSSTDRDRYAGGLVRASCVNNDDDERFDEYCPPFDEQSWCENLSKTGPGTKFYEVCSEACADPTRAFAMVCAWQAVANMRAVCDGTFKPTPPVESANKPNEFLAPWFGFMREGKLYNCDDHAVCYACFGGMAPTEDDGESCERVAAKYGGFGRVDDEETVTGAETAFRALEDVDEWCAMIEAEEEDEDKYGFAPAWVDRGEEYVQRWGTPGAELVEEHVVRDSRHVLERFSKDAYSLWRYVLIGNNTKKFDAELHVHTNAESLRTALREKRVGAGALVFVDLLYALVDQHHFPGTETSLAALADPWLFASSLGMCSQIKHCNGNLNKECVYQFTENVVLRAPALRDLLAYEKPLTIVIGGDLSCRTAGKLPLTHHHLIFANDGAQAAVDEYNERLDAAQPRKYKRGAAPRASFFPFGLEGVPVLVDDNASPLDARSSGFAVRRPSQRSIPMEERSFFVSLSASLNRRKPSRTRLYEWLVEDGGFEAIEAERERLFGDGRIRGHETMSNSVEFFDNRPMRGGAHVKLGADALPDLFEMTRQSVFSVAPAGDFWTSGRVLEAMMLGSIPIVDATYESDGGESAKNCEDPAKFWRDGSDEFPRPAPFLFVDDWAHAPSEIRKGFENHTSWIEELEDYRKALFDHLRQLPLQLKRRIELRLEPSPSSCSSTQLAQSEITDILLDAREYYSTDWFFGFKDSPGNSGVGCTTYPEIFQEWPEGGSYCFDSRCAPPLVKDFTCTFVDSDIRQ